MAKKMKAIDVINSAKMEFSFKKVIAVANNGNEYEILVQEKLNDTKVSGLVTDLVERSEYCDKKGIEFNIIQNIYFLLIKYFTDIKFNKSKDFEKQYSQDLSFIDGLIDLGLFDQIISQFNQESLKSVQNMFEKYTNTLKPVINNEIKKELKVDEKDADSEE